jgi:hypothetical protein
LVGEIDVLGENLLQCHFVYHKPQMLPGREPGPPLELRHGLLLSMLPASTLSFQKFKFYEHGEKNIVSTLQESSTNDLIININDLSLEEIQARQCVEH